MHSFFDSAVLALTVGGSLGLAFIAQKMALAFLLKAMDRNIGDGGQSSNASY